MMTSLQSEAQQLLDAAEKRASSAGGDDLGFFLTTAESGMQLIGINLATGEEVGTVPMAEKQPRFKVDKLSNTVYYMRGNEEVVAYPF